MQYDTEMLLMNLLLSCCIYRAVMAIEMNHCCRKWI